MAFWKGLLATRWQVVSYAVPWKVPNIKLLLSQYNIGYRNKTNQYLMARRKEATGKTKT
jgi:hypothetical protein